ncbi:unnamed protein product [Linum tenue]|uniref:Uncharacterized protein n=1 Tax=Linum tenue TaxID=586396 RepID=A0AAV0LMX9_9ROSI|nr:unnamed protein product [Linum tenue]
MARCFGYQPPESYLKLVEEMRSHGKKDIEKWMKRKSRREAKEAEKITSKRMKHSHHESKEEGEISDVTEEEEEEEAAEKLKSNRTKHSHHESKEEKEEGEISVVTEEEKEEGEISDVTEEHGPPESPCSSSDSVNPRKSFTRIESSKKKKKKETSRHELYEALTTGWTPPPLKMSGPEDLGWLSGSRKTDGVGCQTRRSEVQRNNVLVYALPYTVPI